MGGGRSKRSARREDAIPDQPPDRTAFSKVAIKEAATASLVAGNLDEARGAYSSMQLRATSAEQETVVLRSTVETLRAAQGPIVDRANLLTQFTVNQAQTNAQLTAQQAGEVSPDILLQDFVSSLGLAVALGEASMPDRAISSVTASLQTYMTLNQGTDGVRRLGLRLYQPELGQPTALVKTSFEIAKVPPGPGVPAPRNLYAVLQDKQAVYTNSFWAQFVAGTPPSPPASQIITEIAKVFASVGSWSFPFIVQEASAIANLETVLASVITGKVKAERAAAYAAVVGALVSLTNALNPATRSTFVAGDLFAVAAALDATNQIAKIIPT